ncbi:hypothetical protein LO763_09195 [Glycomyces sp. A-F 0318]|uniref:hypothetical protein n=1 Tax=Glycomyces amatae TaxID=2881355 RepID=UPI001E4FE567|nr:hypothetical protein [Glycomyces amatae]MCD0443797.1 hypothetical protein [Glycomyces amatae]
MNWAWIRALGGVRAAPYEIAAHPLGRPTRPVLSEAYYAKRRRRFRLRYGSRPVRVGGGPGPRPPQGGGLLVLESDLLGPIGEHDDTRPFTPVVLVDGEPVATGFGRGLVTLEAGDHLVQVQAGASAGYHPVRMRPGGHAAVSSFVPQRADASLRGAAFLRQFPMTATGAVPRRIGYLVDVPVTALALVAGVVLGAALMAPLDPPTALGLLAALAIGVVCAVLGHWAVRLLQRLAVARAERRLGSLPAALHAPQPFPGGSWRLIDPHDTAAPAGSDGMAVLRLGLTFVRSPQPRDVPEAPPIDMRSRIGEEYPRRLRRSAFAPGPDPAREAEAAAARVKRFGEAYPPEARPWVDAPLVTVDGEPVPAAWGVNEYRLAPGAHRVDIAAPPPPAVLTGADTAVELGGASATMAVDLRADRPVARDAMARIAMVPAASGRELARYRAELTPDA